MFFFCQKYIRTLSKYDREPRADLPKGLGEGLGEPFSPPGRGSELRGATEGWEGSDPSPAVRGQDKPSDTVRGKRRLLVTNTTQKLS